MVDFRPRDNADDGFDFENYVMADRNQLRIYHFYEGYPYDGSDLAIIEFPEGVDFGIDPVQLAEDYIEYDNDPGIIAGYGVMYWNGKFFVSPDIGVLDAGTILVQ